MLELDSRQKSLVVLNVLGGAAVLMSYALAFAYSPELRAGLWGDLPDALRPLYTTSMLLAAIGYFLLTYQLVLALPPADFRRIVRVPHGVLHAIYALVLIPSAFWLPLTLAMLQAPSDPLWWAIRAALTLVAVGSTALLLLLLQIAGRRGGGLAWISSAGGLLFWFQTAVLDALLWPRYFPA